MPGQGLTHDGGRKAFRCGENCVSTLGCICGVGEPIPTFRDLLKKRLLPMAYYLRENRLDFGNTLGTFLKYLYSIILCTGHTNYINIPIGVEIIFSEK